MTGKLHRTITVVASLAVMLAGLVIITDPSSLGVSADTWKIVSGWVALGSGVLAGVATVFRANLVPNLTTGIGHEEQGTVQTTTLKQETTTTP